MKLNQEDQFIKEIQLHKDSIHSYDAFPFDLPVIKNFKRLLFHPNVTYIIGENGMGNQPCWKGLQLHLDLIQKVERRTLISQALTRIQI